MVCVLIVGAPMKLRQGDELFVGQLTAAVAVWEQQHEQLPGLRKPKTRDCFIRQLLSSDRSRRYIEHFRNSPRLTMRQCDPNGGVFDPYAAAVLQDRDGNFDEAMWLVFLSVHFGRHSRTKWKYICHIYGRLGNGRWDWPSVSSDVGAFRNWLSQNVESIRASGPGGFANHRKRESLEDSGTGEVIASYVDWVGPERGHEAAFAQITGSAVLNPAAEFESLFQSMSVVYRFGRLARFDYLTTASRLGLTSAMAGRAYLPGSTGPLYGARLLFGEATPNELEMKTIDFAGAMDISFAILEDALCNWQKSPNEFIPFRG